MSRQEYRDSAGDYQADELAKVVQSEMLEFLSSELLFR